MGKYDSILNYWGGYVFKTNIDIPDEDIVVAVKYMDHGDDFIAVKTKDEEIYEYGFWGNRDRFYGTYLIDPILNYEKEDEHASLSNAICFRAMEASEGGWTENLKKIVDVWSFNHYISDLKRIFDKYEGVYRSKEKYKNDLIRRLKEINLYTEENIEKVNSLPWTCKVDGVDGIAGKLNGCSIIHADRIDWVYINGEKVEENLKINVSYEDEYCVEIYSLNLNDPIRFNGPVGLLEYGKYFYYNDRLLIKVDYKTSGLVFAVDIETGKYSLIPNSEIVKEESVNIEKLTYNQEDDEEEK